MNVRITTLTALAQLDRRRWRAMVGFCVFGLVGVGLAAGLIGYQPAPAAGQQLATGATVVTVTAGKPSELAFTLSRSSALPWQAKMPLATVVFRLTNKGKLSHGFKVCATPVKSANLNTCNGTGTKLIKPGQSATLTITFKQRGTYEYLSNKPGEAAKGMKGLIGIGVSLGTTASTTTTKPTTPTTTTTTKPVTTVPATTTGTTTTATAPPTITAPSGAAAAGAAVWASGGCSDCHSVADVQAASGGNISPALNSTHTGGPFPNGPLTATQIQQLAAFING